MSAQLCPGTKVGLHDIDFIRMLYLRKMVEDILWYCGRRRNFSNTELTWGGGGALKVRTGKTLPNTAKRRKMQDNSEQHPHFPTRNRIRKNQKDSSIVAVHDIKSLRRDIFELRL